LVIQFFTAKIMLAARPPPACDCGGGQFLWMGPHRARVIHAGGLFLSMASLTQAYSFRFISMLFGAIL